MAEKDYLGNKNFTPPYLDPNTVGDKVLKGVNYASSGSGILNDTGKVWVRFHLTNLTILFVFENNVLLRNFM